jgi:acetyltransferase-like isoleucine patch superfamily enzyme
VEIGDYSFIAHEVVISDHAVAVPPGDEDWAPQSSPRVVIGKNVWIGARATILGEAWIGDNSIIGAGAVVSGRIPPNCIVGGNPGKAVGTIETR